MLIGEAMMARLKSDPTQPFELARMHPGLLK